MDLIVFSRPSFFKSVWPLVLLSVVLLHLGCLCPVMRGAPRSEHREGRGRHDGQDRYVDHGPERGSGHERRAED